MLSRDNEDKFITYIKDGNLKEIEKILADKESGIDINKIGAINDEPIVYAWGSFIKNKDQNLRETHIAILKLLVEKIDKLQGGPDIYSVDSRRQYVNLLAAILETNSFDIITDLPLMKLIIKKTQHLNESRYVYVRMHNPSIEPLISGKKVSNLDHTREQKLSIYKMILCEAILRNDTALLDAFKADGKENGSVMQYCCRDLSSASNSVSNKSNHYDVRPFLNYMLDTVLSPENSRLAEKAIHYLLETDELSIAAASEMMLALKAENKKRMIEFYDLPYVLKLACKQDPRRSLKQLFAELQHLLYPEYDLPVLPIDEDNCRNYLSGLSEDKKDKEDKIENIRNIQNPLNLRAMISNPPELIALLGLSINSGRQDSPALVLLTQILFFMWDKPIETIGNNQILDEPLLSRELKHKCKQILCDFYQSKPDMLVTYSLFRSQKELMLDLQGENKNLLVKVEEMQQENKNLSAKMDEMQQENRMLCLKVDEMQKEHKELMLKVNETNELLKMFLLNAQNQNMNNSEGKSQVTTSLKLFGR
jgi:hypothetical protein